MNTLNEKELEKRIDRIMRIKAWIGVAFFTILGMFFK
jgi:hypothetical protein